MQPQALGPELQAPSGGGDWPNQFQADMIHQPWCFYCESISEKESVCGRIHFRGSIHFQEGVHIRGSAHLRGAPLRGESISVGAVLSREPQEGVQSVPPFLRLVTHQLAGTWCQRCVHVLRRHLGRGASSLVRWWTVSKRMASSVPTPLSVQELWQVSGWVRPSHELMGA